MTVTLIAAVASNGVIGNDNRMPWRLPADMKFFVRETSGKPVLMGRTRNADAPKHRRGLGVVRTADGGDAARAWVDRHHGAARCASTRACGR